MKPLLLLISFYFAAFTLAGGDPYEQFGEEVYTFQSCSSAMSATATFCDIGTHRRGAMTMCICRNQFAMATFTGCINNGAQPKHFDYLISSCAKFNVIVTPERIQQSYLNFTKYAKTIHEIPHFNRTMTVRVPLKLDSLTVALYKKAYTQFYGNRDHALYYGSGMLGFWLLVFICGAVSKWSKILMPGLVKWFTGPISNSWRKHVTLPATGRRAKTNDKKVWKIFHLLVPSRKETIIIFLFCCLTIFCNAHMIVYTKNDPFSPLGGKPLVGMWEIGLV